MRVSPLVKLIPVLGLVMTPPTLSHSTKDNPQCWQDCLKSNDVSCKDTDYTCICSSAPSHISPFLACVDSKCSDASAYLSTLRETCPLPTSQSSSVESIATDVAHPTLLASSTSLSVISTTTVIGSAVSATTTATPTATTTATATAKSDDGGGQGGGDGTVLDLQGGGRKREGGCLLGLTVGILAGIAWF